MNVTKVRPINPDLHLTHDFCDTSIVLYQLSQLGAGNFVNCNEPIGDLASHAEVLRTLPFQSCGQSHKNVCMAHLGEL